MAETVTLQIPEALYQRLAIAAGATQRSRVSDYDRSISTHDLAFNLISENC